jgi:alpha-galactosidase
MFRSFSVLGLTTVFSLSLAVTGWGKDVLLSTLDLTRIVQGYGSPQADKSVGGNPLSIGGVSFAHGVGTHAISFWYIDLKNGSEHFHASVGVDDDMKTSPDASVKFVVSGDGRTLWESEVLRADHAPVPVDIDVRGVRILVLEVRDGVQGNRDDHADWADARLSVTGAMPESIPVQVNMFSEILTPKPGPEPRIHGAHVFGVRPGSPFLYAIAATGTRPLTFAVDSLPAGLTLDASTGQITGSVTTAGRYPVTLRASNSLGQAKRPFTIVVGDKICLTPPLGWNSWNSWAGLVDQQKVLRAAQAMVSSGLAQHGWSYVNIDDTWQGKRGGDFNGIQPNEKFPDMKGLVDQIHGLGLKAGIYSTPWQTSYAGFIGGSSDQEDGSWPTPHPGGTGKHVFATQDAKQWAAWGIDYLKYDWSIDVPETKRMSDALRAQNRDIVYSLSNSANFAWVSSYVELANAWRTTSDIRDNWASMSGIGFAQGQWASYAGPGHFNDPDMLVVGETGGYEGPPHPTQLTPDEQYTHISLWALLAAPLLIGCDLDKLDDFTLNLLENDEVLDIDQDATGHEAVCVHTDGDANVYCKTLEDGSLAVGLFNRGADTRSVTANWADLGLKGKHMVRDVWRQKDLGTFMNKFTATVHGHGVVLLRILPSR